MDYCIFCLVFYGVFVFGAFYGVFVGVLLIYDRLQSVFFAFCFVFVFMV